MVSLAADKGYDSKQFRDTLRDKGVRPLIKHRLYQPIDYAHNARLSETMYNQRSLTETVNSVIKRKLRETVSARTWYRQYRELTITASVYNINRALTAQPYRRTGIQ